MMLIQTSKENYLDVSVLIGESIEHLMKAFGDPLTIYISRHTSPEDGQETVKIMAQLNCSYEEAKAMRESFWDNWWVDNCHRSHCALIFDFITSERLALKEIVADNPHADPPQSEATPAD